VIPREEQASLILDQRQATEQTKRLAGPTSKSSRALRHIKYNTPESPTIKTELGFHQTASVMEQLQRSINGCVDQIRAHVLPTFTLRVWPRSAAAKISEADAGRDARVRLHDQQIFGFHVQVNHAGHVNVTETPCDLEKDLRTVSSQCRGHCTIAVVAQGRILSTTTVVVRSDISADPSPQITIG
jgi:hypothetical protein